MICPLKQGVAIFLLMLACCEHNNRQTQQPTEERQNLHDGVHHHDADIESSDVNAISHSDTSPDDGEFSKQQCLLSQLTSLEVHENYLKLRQPIRFDNNSLKVLPASQSILDEVAFVMRKCPNISIEVQVHTDKRGSQAFNFWLSHDRARNLTEYLAGQGIDAGRLTFQGYGDLCPRVLCIQSGNPAEDYRQMREKNNRVELIRTDQPEVMRLCPAPAEPPMPDLYKRIHRKPSTQ